MFILRGGGRKPLRSVRLMDVAFWGLRILCFGILGDHALGDLDFFDTAWQVIF